MECSNNIDLQESLFFTERKARLPSDPTSYYSTRIHSLMERTSELNMSKEDSEIEASRDHWTEVESEYHTAVTTIESVSSSSASELEPVSSSSTSKLEPVSSVEDPLKKLLEELQRLEMYVENAEVIKSLQRQNPESRFFQIEGKVGKGGVVMGKKIAEGGQAEIYEATFTESYEATIIPDSFDYDPTEKYEVHLVLKVFKEGFSLRDLHKQWPIALLHQISPLNDEHSVRVACNPILYGRLLGNGRFAFGMMRLWGDLRKFLDLRMQHNGNQHPPFMMPHGNYYECCMVRMMLQIAIGMNSLHEQGILHRDLKASNILIHSKKLHEAWEGGFDPVQQHHDLVCLLADYECSIGVLGTGLWRAPEILEAVKNRIVHNTPTLFTQHADVYSYAMICYEILTGYVPFEDVGGAVSIDDVLQGRRPKLPSHLRPWVKELLTNCWHVDPSERPLFKKIVGLLRNIILTDPYCQVESVLYKFHTV